MSAFAPTEKGYYGPYAHNLTHLLKHINGFYIYFKSQRKKPDTTVRLSDDKLKRVEKYVQNKLDDSQKDRVNKLLDLIEGFESPYGLELLATVDYIREQKPGISFEKLKDEVHNWTRRKKSIMKPYHLEVAYKRLKALGM